MRRWPIIIFAFLSILIFGAGTAFGGISGYSTTVDPDKQENTFHITFTDPPDFFTVDEYGRQKDGFQYYIDADRENPTNQWLTETIIRGEEINVGKDIKIRDTFGDGEADAYCGGWGSVRGSIPYKLDHKKLTFTVPWSVLNDPDGAFSYQLIYTSFGGMTSIHDVMYWDSEIGAWGHSPEPSSMLLFVVGGLGIALINKRRKK